MNTQTFDITQAPVADWRVDFGLWLRHTPTQKRTERAHLSVMAYESDVAQMGAWFARLNGCDFVPHQMTTSDTEAYFAQMTFAPATYNRKLAAARMLVKWAMGAGLLTEDPTAWIPFADATRQSPRDVSDDERMMLEMAAEENEGTLIGLRDSLIFFLMSNAGLRINEVVTLKISDVKLDERTLHVLGKGKKHRTVDIGGRLLAKIKAWMEKRPTPPLTPPHLITNREGKNEGTLVTDEKGKAIGRGQAWRRFGLIAKRAEVKVTPHAMRHTFVVRFMDAMMAGDPWKLPAAIDAVCQQTGDKPEVILAYYTRARKSDMRAAAEVM